ncbi:hypothetical protein FACS1894151_05870 [Spirochaetia bacterium]|nr:hypothetical protein FACS1894151_05870 [Spirochaetia bacterium]
MGIFDRLGQVIKSYLNAEEEGSHEKTSGKGNRGDPDLEAAFEELDDYLSGGKKKAERDYAQFTGTEYGQYQKGGGQTAGSRAGTGNKTMRQVPEELRGDFTELGVPFASSAEDCKTAYKNLLKKHHPDRHAGHAENMRKATEKTARINAAYDRIEKWYSLVKKPE